MSRLKSSRLFLYFQNFKKNRKYIKDNFRKFAKEEKREIKKLIQKKESWKKYCHDSVSIFKDYFIPGDYNDNRPKILQPKQLTIIVILLLLLKVSLVGYVFTVYQNKAEMSATIANQVLILTNEARVASGAEKVSLDPHLTQAAQLKAEDMVINNYFSHTSLDGRKPWDFVSRSLYPYLLVGENLGMNFMTGGDVHSALMASPSHRRNLLNPKYTDIGIYVMSGSINGQETNILVQIFAYKKTEEIVAPVVKDVQEKEAPEINDNLVIDSPDSSILGLSGLSLEAEDQKISANDSVSNVVGEDDNTSSDLSSPVKQEKEVQKTEVEPDIYQEPELAQAEAKTLSSEQNIELINVEKINLPVESSLPNEVDNNIPLTTKEDIIQENTEEINVEILEAEANLISEAVRVNVNQDEDVSRAVKISIITKLIYVVLLSVLIIILLINILVRAVVKHKSIILRAILLIILIIALIFFDFDFIVQLRNSTNSIILF